MHFKNSIVLGLWKKEHKQTITNIHFPDFFLSKKKILQKDCWLFLRQQL